MGKVLKAVIFVVVVIFALAVLFAISVDESSQRARELQEKTIPGTIVGGAFFDKGYWGTLDWRDTPAEGFVVELYEVIRAEKEMEGNQVVLIATTKVDSTGQYQFVVSPDREYMVIPKLTMEGYPGWYSAQHLLFAGNIFVEEGETVLGPIFLIQ